MQQKKIQKIKRFWFYKSEKRFRKNYFFHSFLEIFFCA